MKVLHVDLLSRRNQFSSIPASTVAYRMVSIIHIMLALHLLHENISLDSSVMGYISKTSFDKVWKNISPGDGRSCHSLVVMTIMILHDASSASINVFCSPTPSGVLIPEFPYFIL